LLRCGLAILTTLAAYRYLLIDLPDVLGNVLGQIVSTLATLVIAALAINWTSNRKPAEGQPDSYGWIRPINLAWLGLLAIIVLQALLVTHLPYESQTGFEELQTGGIAYRILNQGQLDIEFRFTNLIAALGFATGGYTLDAMRTPFRFAGAVSLCLAALTLRRLQIRWLPTLAAVLILGTLRMLVIGSGTADELFAGVLFLLGLIYCVACFETSTEQPLFWSCAVGCMAGMLLFEYTSYRAGILFAFGWIILRAIWPAPAHTPRTIRYAPVFFLLAMLAFAAPTIIQTVINPNDSIMLEGFRRHSAERPPLPEYIPQFMNGLQQYSLAVIGLPSEANGLLYALNKEPLMPIPVGILLVIGLTAGLLRPARSLGRGLAVTIIAMVLIVALSTNNLNIGRLTPAIVLLILLSGLALHSLIEGIDMRILAWLHTSGARKQRAKQKSGTQRRNVILMLIAQPIQITVCGLCLFICFANIAAIDRFAKSVQLRREYSNDAYVTCREAGRLARPNQTVVLYFVEVPGGCTGPDTVWLIPPQIVMQSVTQLPTLGEILPNSLVAIGKMNGLHEEDIQRFLDLVNQSHSVGSLRATEDIDGRPVFFSFCYQCSEPPPGPDP
jgi:hypothetical protein